MADLNGPVEVESPTPPACLKEPCLMGIDEAGRGPVLGPMVYGAAYCPISEKGVLKKFGFADSKQLSESDRDRLFAQLKKAPAEKGFNIGWLINSLSSEDISGWMLQVAKYNLNAISHDTAIGLIRRVLAMGVNLSEVYIDTVGDPDKYQQKLAQLFPALKIVVSKKADSLFPIVSAASICAKVSRDAVLSKWTFKEPDLDSTDYGSGYPGDPKTKAWLQGNIDPVFGFPSLVRFSWGTCKKILEDKAIEVEWPYEESDGDENDDVEEMDTGTPVKKQVSLATFFSGPAKEEPTKKRCFYFTDRSMEVVSDF